MKSGELPKSACVLLLVDFINPLDFPGAEDLAPRAVEAATATAILKNKLHALGVPAIYANDNFGGWQSDFRELVATFRKRSGPAATIAKLLAPQHEDLTILKPMHSAFHGSPLDLLLRKMRTSRIIVTGLATDICIQLTVMDAFLRGYTTCVPSDCTAAEKSEDKKQALSYMQRVLKSDIAPSAFIECKSPRGAQAAD